MTEKAQNADFRTKPQIFADSPLLLEIQAFGERRKPQKTADFRRKPKIFAENRSRLGSVTLGASPLARRYSFGKRVFSERFILITAKNAYENRAILCGCSGDFFNRSLQKLDYLGPEDSRFPCDQKSLAKGDFLATKTGKTDSHCGNSLRYPSLR